MNRLIPSLCLLTVLHGFICFDPLYAEELEVLHWWSSGSEAESLNTLKKTFKSSGFTWKDSKIIGGGGANAEKALKQRVSSGDAPGVVQLKSAALPQWGALGALQTIDEAAKQQDWKAILPNEVLKSLKYNGSFVSAPLNVHRINWLWINKSLLKKVGGTIPTKIEDIFHTLEKFKKANILPLAHGGQPWQDATLFETILLSAGGTELYRKILVDLDSSSSRSAKMIEVFQILRRLTSYMSDDRRGLDWDKATKLVIDGKAGMQFMGDWAKGEFLKASKEPGRDFICAVSPGSQNAFIYTIDSFAFFKTKSKSLVKAQNKLASIVMDKAFQINFNLKKGSIPVRTDINLDSFDLCAKRSAKDFAEADKNSSLVPSFAHGNARPSDIQEAVSELASLFLNSEMSPKEASVRLSAVLKEFE